MTTRRDDDALHWEGDDDPTLDVGAAPAPGPLPEHHEDDAPLALPDGFTPLGRGSDQVGRIDADGTVVMPGDRAPLSNTMLVLLGVVGGVALLYTIGWVVGGLRLQGTAEFLVSPIGYRVAFWLAVAAPALWFVTALVLTRTSKTWIRVAALVAGFALLVPWPFIMVGAVGAVAS